MIRKVIRRAEDRQRAIAEELVDMPADVGAGDNPYEFLLGRENVIPND